MILLVLCSGIICLLGTGTSPATAGKPPFLRTQAADNFGGTLTFAERVGYQYAIEEVYWRHRIWPKDNPAPRPSLDAIVSQREIEKKVEDYLRMSELLAEQWQRPITPEQLQAEMERMASHSRQPEVLRELFAALENDPLLVAECLARPLLAARILAEEYGGGSTSPLLDGKSNREPIKNSWPSGLATDPLDAAYKLPEISVSMDCIDNTWAATTTVNAPEARYAHTAVWTGSEMIVWGGGNLSSGSLNTGARYNPATDSWIATSTSNAPSARGFHSAVWTGTAMIIWGGGNATNDLDTGGRYDLATNSWTATSTANAPLPRDSHSAVWTGSEMIVWGGSGCGGNCRWNTGGRYNPSTDTWTAISTVNAPSARWDHTAVWTGSEMIIWGGTDQTNYLRTGARYNPRTDTWTPTQIPNPAIPGRYAFTAIWSGSEMIVWGGVDENFNDTNTGGRYNPSTIVG